MRSGEALDLFGGPVTGETASGWSNTRRRSRPSWDDMWLPRAREGRESARAAQRPSGAWQASAASSTRAGLIFKFG